MCKPLPCLPFLSSEHPGNSCDCALREECYHSLTTLGIKLTYRGSHWRAGRVSEQVLIRHGFLHFSVSGHSKVLCNRDDELMDKYSFIKSYAWKKLCGTGQGMKWEALSHGKWMQVALGVLCNAWVFCERRKGRKVRDSWSTNHVCSWYFNYSHIFVV